MLRFWGKKTNFKNFSDSECDKKIKNYFSLQNLKTYTPIEISRRTNFDMGFKKNDIRSGLEKVDF